MTKEQSFVCWQAGESKRKGHTCVHVFLGSIPPDGQREAGEKWNELFSKILCLGSHSFVRSTHCSPPGTLAKWFFRSRHPWAGCAESPPAWSSPREPIFYQRRPSSPIVLQCIAHEKNRDRTQIRDADRRGWDTCIAHAPTRDAELECSPQNWCCSCSLLVWSKIWCCSPNLML